MVCVGLVWLFTMRTLVIFFESLPDILKNNGRKQAVALARPRFEHWAEASYDDEYADAQKDRQNGSVNLLTEHKDYGTACVLPLPDPNQYPSKHPK